METNLALDVHEDQPAREADSDHHQLGPERPLQLPGSNLLRRPEKNKTKIQLVKVESIFWSGPEFIPVTGTGDICCVCGLDVSEQKVPGMIIQRLKVSG